MSKKELFFPSLETERLVLRPLDMGDAEPLFAIFSDDEVMRYWNSPPWQTIDDSKAFIQASHSAMVSGESLTLGMYLKSNEQLVGKCMLFSYSAHSRRAEIGFGLGKANWGQGYVREAANALIEYGFGQLSLRRIEAEIDPLNTSSANALEKLGFVQEGMLRQRWEIDGVISDSALYGLLASDVTQ
ncbi:MULTISPECIES: GNAT family N-acetyltransferase [Vibrio]|uniref:Putative acetyltransferase n=1 Tax=Vibrio proteolyticus NBRC 13287 TaxID=1219065 RepID=U2ZI85_VIBPR|nr:MULTISPECIES: GNAT family protein [Vibrio]NAW56421.1 GNAT family N-acetyltransferase [Vibrio sp. V36_P2S2PM302]NAX28117.1 GNAT family N-acetyltransferase [Vibrio sp. V38_P2S17PM301]NAX32212.1 GNAT family N-acetyltransferase [Vibrio sp. V37_P2S8PM304]GAD67376.1 putative acetyltransferase [Vibrio proteolyticus NBRC 13287]